MQRLRRLFHFVTPYGGKMVVATLSILFGSLIMLALPYAVRILVNSVIVNRDLAQLNTIGLGLLALFLLQSAFTFLEAYLMAFVAQRVVADIRLELQQRLIDLPLRFFTEGRVGELVSRLTNDVAVIQSALTDTPVNLLGQLVTFAGALTLMFMLNWRLSLLVFAIVPPLILLAMMFGRRLEKLSTAVQDRLAEATTALEEALAGIRVVKSFTQERAEKERYRARIETTFDTVHQRIRLRAILIPLMNLLALGSITLIIWVGGRQVVEGNVSPGDLIAFLFYALMITGPLESFAAIYAQLREAMGASARMIEILDAAPEPGPGAECPALPPTKGRVRFVDVCFEYEAGNPVLSHIDLEIQPAQMIAIVGPSGVGKTTLVNLIPRFYEPSHGRIEIDGTDIAGADLRSLRGQVGLVPQETFLFGGSVRENIAYGRPGATDDEIIAAAQAANAHDFIRELAQGYDTPVGERGAKLSAGQRQRIAIARALLKDPRILILDEATSALDTESERLVQAALERLMHGRTAFVIAHRLSTIQRADRILVLHEGRIVEDGTHAALLAQGGMYHRLWNLQFSEEGKE